MHNPHNPDDVALLEQVAELEALVPMLPLKDHEFATSIIARAKAGTLKSTQWVGNLIERAKKHAGGAAVAKPFPPDVDPNAIKIRVKRIVEIFALAAAHLKLPKVWIGWRQSELPIRIVKAGPLSRFHGQLIVGDGMYGGRFFGHIDENGLYHRGKDHDDKVLERVVAFCGDPVRFAREFGKLTGHCCFCSLPLTDDRSVQAGYGPICADHYGLPWGETVPVEDVENIAEAA